MLHGILKQNNVYGSLKLYYSILNNFPAKKNHLKYQHKLRVKNQVIIFELKYIIYQKKQILHLFYKIFVN